MRYFRFLLFYFFYWHLLFEAERLVFVSYEYNLASNFTLRQILPVFWYGMRLDLSFAAYCCVLPFMLLLFAGVIPKKILQQCILIYTVTLTTVLTFIYTADLETYRAWGFRLDATPLQYISSPGEMMASMSSAPIFTLICIWLFMLCVSVIVYARLALYVDFTANITGLQRVGGFLALALLILPMRGGWQQIPINQSAVYFSEHPFLNHVALNVPWNIAYSLSQNDLDNHNPYSYLPQQKADSIIKDLFKPSPVTLQLTSLSKPNVVLIILESFTANLMESYGGVKGITPNLDSVAKNGLMFANIYASGDRSEKGLAAILSGYPAQPATSVMKVPTKTELLPFLSASFKTAGYHTAYYYGGELGFANLKSYLVNGKFDKLISKPDFNSKDYNSKWGAHDHVVLNRVLQDLKETKQPFFTTVFTLSSHEPYDVPGKPLLRGNSEENQFLNSAHYTDQSIGHFICAAKKEAWWANTLVVLVADHGHRYPGNVAHYVPAKFRIPLLVTGGALQRIGTVYTTGSQTDLATTLLSQLKMPTVTYKWGHDLLAAKPANTAFYVFNNGFGFVTDSATVVIDNVAKREMYRQGNVTKGLINQGKAYMQNSYQDFINR